MNKLILVLLFTLLSGASFAVEHKELKAFPKAKDGMKRHVIVLPHKERGEEDNYKVEIIPGKMMLSDGVNRMRLGISLEAKPLKGWGYTFYEVKGKALTMSTLIAPPPGTKKVNKFVQGKGLLIRYNSRLPIVIYTQEDFEIRYRIWQAPDKFSKAEQG